MYKRRKPRPLSAHDIEIIRMVARCQTNRQIAEHFGITHYTIRGQLHNLHHQLGIDTGSRDDNPSSLMARLRMVAWAYENGLMGDQDAATVAARVPAMPAAPAPAAPALPEPLLAAVLDLCEAIVCDRPRGDLRKIAAEVLRTAGRRRRPNDQRAKPAPRS